MIYINIYNIVFYTTYISNVITKNIHEDKIKKIKKESHMKLFLVTQKIN